MCHAINIFSLIDIHIIPLPKFRESLYTNRIKSSLQFHNPISFITKLRKTIETAKYDLSYLLVIIKTPEKGFGLGQKDV